MTRKLQYTIGGYVVRMTPRVAALWNSGEIEYRDIRQIDVLHTEAGKPDAWIRMLAFQADRATGESAELDEVTA